MEEEEGVEELEEEPLRKESNSFLPKIINTEKNINFNPTTEGCNPVD